MQRVYDPEQLKLKEVQKYYASQKSKTYNYTESDFSIDLLSNKWKHLSWKTWCKGGNDYAETKDIVKRYISECSKPYGKRDLSFVHLVSD